MSTIANNVSERGLSEPSEPHARQQFTQSEQDPSKTTDNSNLTPAQMDNIFDAHALVHLIQCPRCSGILQTPTRLPCGYTTCRACLPPLKRREGISYPQGEGREEGFTCFWKGRCDAYGQDDVSGDDGRVSLEHEHEHSVADCGVDVVLSKIVDVFSKVFQRMNENSDGIFDTATDVKIQWRLLLRPPSESAATDDMTTSSIPAFESTISPGRYLGIYKLAKERKIPYDTTDVIFEDLTEELPDNPNNPRTKLDTLVFSQLKQGIRDELDCQVCYALLYQPWISLCGHTFCRDCTGRVFDHSDLCPLCRRKMSFSSTTGGAGSAHTIIRNLLKGLYAEETTAREAAIRADHEAAAGDGQLPLFVCTLAFPSMPTHLHIFEPRYRLMIRRALEYGRRRFGMVVENFDADSVILDHDNGARAPFMQYGTVVTIDTFEVLTDGRMVLTAMGTSRFKVVRWGVLDGYYTALTERVDDINLAEEEAIESREVAATASSSTVPSTPPPTAISSETEAQTPRTDIEAESQPGEAGPEARTPSLDTLSTQQLMQICKDFLERQGSEATPWLHRHVIGAFGQPPSDPAIFPYWFASVFPVPDEEAYKLLHLTSVRERLKVVATWPRMLDNNGW